MTPQSHVKFSSIEPLCSSDSMINTNEHAHYYNYMSSHFDIRSQHFRRQIDLFKFYDRCMNNFGKHSVVFLMECINQASQSTKIIKSADLDLHSFEKRVYHLKKAMCKVQLLG